ncbi:hypothetical protein LIA77_09343 [Sarocladium implicatum]|nr:hypothetical protein LIA77_09343 [Sarocladium implicatum]
MGWDEPLLSYVGLPTHHKTVCQRHGEKAGSLPYVAQGSGMRPWQKHQKQGHMTRRTLRCSRRSCQHNKQATEIREPSRRGWWPASVSLVAMGHHPAKVSVGEQMPPLGAPCRMAEMIAGMPISRSLVLADSSGRVPGG